MNTLGLGTPPTSGSFGSGQSHGASSSHSTGASSSQSNHSPDNFKIVRKRNRVPLSCGPCRHRKLKCNRQSPCENCVKRADAESCTYASLPPKTRRSTGGDSDKSSPDDMQQRIDRLESLVLSLMGSNGGRESKSGDSASKSESSPKDDIKDDDSYMDVEDSISDDGTQDEESVKPERVDELEDVRSKLGFMKMNNGKSMYRGASHWALVLNEISEVKSYMAANQSKFSELQAKEMAETKVFGSAAFPFSAARALPAQDILKLMPPKGQVDILLGHWMEQFDHSYHISHGPTFRKEYAEYWKDPSKADITWVGILFGMMVVIIQSIQACGIIPFGLEMEEGSEEKFKFAQEQCLVAGNFYTKASHYTIQCFIVYMMGAKGGTDQVWLMLGLVLRIAMSMGLHRDSTKFQVTISPYQAELRTRLWNFLLCMDLAYSIKIGLPCIVRSGEADMGLPSNLHDYEYGEDSTELPPSRPLKEQTPMSYMIAKTRITLTFSKIINAIQTLHPCPSYSDVFILEKELRQAQSEIPEFLKYRPMEASELDHPWLITQRFALDVIFQKALLVLHRPYFTKAHRSNIKYEKSRRVCLESAMILLSHQSELFEAQNGRLKQSRWSIEALTTSDFLPATMIIMLELWNSTTDEEATFVVPPETRDIMMKALEQASSIIKQQGGGYEMLKARSLMEHLVEKMRQIIYRPQNVPPVSAPSFSQDYSRASGNDQTSGVKNEALKSDHSAALTLGMMSTGGVSPSLLSNLLSAPEQQQAAKTQTPQNGFAPTTPSAGLQYFGQGMGMNLDSGNGLDWNEWDNFLQGINLDTSGQSWMSNLPLSPLTVPGVTAGVSSVLGVPGTTGVLLEGDPPILGSG